jgi:hypothetical protein
MREAWTGRLVGKMHVHEITSNDLAKETGKCKAYVSMMLSGKRNPPGGRELLEQAVERLIAKKEVE